MGTQIREASGMTGANPVPVSRPAVPGMPARFPRWLARALAWGPRQAGRAAVRWTVNGMTWAGALLVPASAIIHRRLRAGGGYQGIAVMWRRPPAHSRRVWPPEA